MRLCRSLKQQRGQPVSVAVTAVSVAFAVLLTLANPASGQASDGRASEAAGRFSCDPSHVWVLLLFDTSGSLKRTDPGFERRVGGAAALDALRQLQRDYPGSRIHVSTDNFAARYVSREWTDLARASDGDISRLVDQTWQVASANNGAFTDYAEAMQGAVDKMAEVDAAACKHVVWFTDGQHDTTPDTSFRVTDAESEEVSGLCLSSGANRELRRRNVWVTSVNLASDGAAEAPETLRRLYDDGEVACRYPLRGAIIKVGDVGNLAGEIAELLEDLPFESLESVPESEPCVFEQPTDRACEYGFVLEDGNESFEIFVDLKGLNDADLVEIFLVPPDGSTEMPLQFGASRREDRRTGFLLTASTTNWRKIEGHQAARQNVDRRGQPWRWAGEWTLRFRGDESSLAKVTPPRFTSSALPSFDARYRDETDSLEGEISVEHENLNSFAGAVRMQVNEQQFDLPLEAQAVDAALGSRFTWQVQDVASKVLEAVAADGSDAAAVLRQSAGRVIAAVRLVKTVDWGSGQPLQWEVPGSRVEMSIPISVVAWEGDGLHPRSVVASVEDATLRAGRGSIDIAVEPGEANAMLRLSELSVFGDQTVEVQAHDGEWRCEVPSTAGAKARLHCPPLEVDVAADTDALVTIALELVSELDSFQQLMDRATAQGFGADAKARLAPMEHASVVESVRIATPETSTTLTMFAALLALYAVGNLACRFLLAWLNRNWDPLESDSYWRQEFQFVDPRATGSGEAKHSRCHELSDKSRRADLDGLSLQMVWMRAMVGNADIVAIAPTGSRGVVTAASNEGSPIRKRSSVGVRLKDGWAAVVSSEGDRAELYIWDAEPENRPHDRIRDALPFIEGALKAASQMDQQANGGEGTTDSHSSPEPW